MRITHRSGKVFVLRPERNERSPLDVPGVDTGITRQEILDSIREGREQEIRARRDRYGGG